MGFFRLGLGFNVSPQPYVIVETEDVGDAVDQAPAALLAKIQNYPSWLASHIAVVSAQDYSTLEAAEQGDS